MGVFKKKPDPISERARELNAKIAALEAQIQRLSEEKPAAPTAPESASPPRRHEAEPPPSAAPHAPSPQPRLRSTALPHGPTIHPTASAPPAPPPQEPIFEELDPERFEAEEKPSPPELGMRKKGFLPFLDKMKIHFRGPATSNPKLVNYLAAGSIQGLRPLRYEKRVARNRFIVLAGVLILALWGILALLLKHR
jgi:hypothetical protein